MATIEKTRLCGCGNCRFVSPDKGPCPKQNDPSAEWLWATTSYRDSEDQEEEGASNDSGN